MTDRRDEPSTSQAQAATARPVVLASTSRAADAGYRALADLVEIAADLGVDYRVVGGHMVTLLVAAYGVSQQVPMRETADVDFAALPEVIADPRLPAALRARGYISPGSANRFVREHQDGHGRLDLVVDILAPSYQAIHSSGPRQRVGLANDRG